MEKNSRVFIDAKERDRLKRILFVLGIVAVIAVGVFIIRPIFLHSGSVSIGPSAATATATGLEITHAPTAESAARAFLNAWQSENFAGMYSLLSQKIQTGLTQDQFQKIYQDFRQTVTLRSLDYRILSVDVTPTDSTVQFEVTIHTVLAGDIVRPTRMLLTNQNGVWKVAWDPETILPDLQNGNQLVLNRSMPPRGNIYDRAGLPLAADAKAVEIGVVPGRITDEDRMLACLSAVLHKPRELIRTMYDLTLPDTYFPVGDVNQADIPDSCSFAALSNTDGVQLETTEMRYYFGGGVGSNVVGYTKKPSPEDIANGSGGDDRLGANGLELWGEGYLAGRGGGSLMVTSSTGAVVSTLAEFKPLPAMDIYTTLDRDLQAQIERTVMGPFLGAVVVLNRNTGEVLAMMSSPRYDSNYFNPESFNGTTAGALGEILQSTQSPLLNRAAQGLYPLGSVFKIITMSTALQSGMFDPNSIVYNDQTGYFTELDGFNGTDWTVEKEMKPQGKESLTQCLERSTNTCFWHVALAMYYRDAWLVPNMAMAFGLGQKTGIVGVADEPGLLPNPGSKHDSGGGDWTGGDALNQAIGQGSLEVTPLQVADFVAAVGNGGTLYRPQILYSIRPPDGSPVFTFAPDTRGYLPVSQANLLAVQQAMVGVVNDPHGTAYNHYWTIADQLRIAGKSGTAQTDQAYPDAWFVAYTYNNFPNKPDIAVVAIVENVGEGSTFASPMVRRVLEIYFQGRPKAFYAWESTYGMRGTSTPVESETPTETPTETPAP